MNLLVTTPEPGTLNRRTLAGLAPMIRESGAARGKRTFQAGRAKPRKALYMATLTADRRNSMFMPHYQQLTACVKPVKVVLCAIARKLPVHLNSRLREVCEIMSKSSHTCPGARPRLWIED